MFANHTQNKAKILIIGDSISIGYTPFVIDELKQKADVFHNPGNGQHTGTGIKNIENWIGDQQYDIIQFNWGLWDLCYRNPDSKVQGNRDKENGKLTYTLDQYAANLDSIVSLLKAKTNAKLIFVTTTFVPDKEAGRFQHDAIRYNEAAKKVMNKHGIEINDIYEPSIEIHQKYGKGPDNVHYNTQGYKELGQLIIDFLLKKI